MPLGIEAKQGIVSDVNEVAKGALSAAIAEYRGITVSDMTQLRKKAREQGIYLRVVRNTLARRAVEGTDFECMKEAFVGPTIVAFATEEPGGAARLFRDFAKQNDNLKVTALSVGGELLGADKLEAIAKLPTRDEALALLLNVMKAPITKLTRTLNDVPGRVTRVVAAVRDQKQEA